MDNQYKSLTDKLIQNGIIDVEESQNLENFFKITPDEDMSHSPFIQKPEQETETKEKNEKEKNKKRINQYDLELLKGTGTDESSIQNASFKIIERFLNFKETMAQKGNIKNTEKFLFTFFPKLYKAKLVKDAMSKFSELNIDPKILLNKTVPYGESETRYQSLIKYLNYANEIQAKLKKKI